MTAQERAVYRRGTRRVVPPDVTWGRLGPLLIRCGVTRVADVTGLDRLGVPVFQAVRPAARSVSVSQGKGVDPMAARVSAAMEAVELWHAENVPAEAGHVATAREQRPGYPLDALDVAPFTVLHDDLQLRWLPATGLVTGAASVVPLDLVRLDHTYAPRWAPPLFRTTSNGLASGNTLAEATAHALAELCERDCLARLRQRDPSGWPWLDLTSVPDPDVAALLVRFRDDGSTVEVVVAHDPGRSDEPACFEARIRSPLHRVTFTGAGCHPEPTVALLRALTEAAQSRLTAITGARDDLPGVLYRSGPVPSPGPAARTGLLGWTAAAGGRSASDDVRADQERLAGVVLARTGHEPLRVTLHDGDVAVVKVVAPGLCFDDRVDVSRPAAGGVR